jgi:hypothetical protein
MSNIPKENPEGKRQHLEFIQNVITRMNSNSFQIKELTVLIVTAALAIYAAERISLMLLIPVLPTIVLWLLDSYYLQQERKFRGIYDDVAGLKNINTVKLYEMPIQKYTPDKKKSFGFRDVVFSSTICPFYILLIITPCIFFIVVECLKIK